MKSHAKIFRSKDGKYFTMRLWLTGADASHHAWAGRKAWTIDGFAWQRSTERGAVHGKCLYGNYFWDFRRKDCELIRHYFDFEPGERKYFPIEFEEGMLFVKFMEPVTMEELRFGK